MTSAWNDSRGMESPAPRQGTKTPFAWTGTVAHEAPARVVALAVSQWMRTQVLIAAMPESALRKSGGSAQRGEKE